MRSRSGEGDAPRGFPFPCRHREGTSTVMSVSQSSFASDVAIIEQLVHAYTERVAKGDLESVADLFVHGAVSGDAHPEPAVGRAAVLDLYRARLHLYETTHPVSRFYLRPMLFARHVAELIWFGLIAPIKKDARLTTRVKLVKGVWHGYN